MTIRKTGPAGRAATGLALAGVLMLAMGTEGCAETQEESTQEDPAQEASAQLASAEQEAPGGDEAAQQEVPAGDETAQQEEPAQEDPPERQPSRNVRDTIERFRQVDPGISDFFANGRSGVQRGHLLRARFGSRGFHGRQA